MSDIEKLFITAYPLFPKALLKKFSSLLTLELAKFDKSINPEIISTYSDLASRYKSEIYPSIKNESIILSPANQSKIKNIYYENMSAIVFDGFPQNQEWQKSDVWESMIFLICQTMKYSGVIRYDQRLFSGVTSGIDIEYTPLGYTRDMSFFISDRAFSTVDAYSSKVYLSLNVIPVEYAGVNTVVAMIENGIKLNINTNLVYEFATFINAYNKFGNELAAKNSLHLEINRQAVLEYKNITNEKLKSRKNELNDLSIQISFAAKNETNSAKRDMQNLSLSAQSLMVQLQEKLK